MPRKLSVPNDMRIKRLGEKLRAIRQHAGLSCEQMAAELGRTEKARRSRVVEWETDKRDPPLPIILRYAHFAGISTDVILDDDLDLPAAENQE
jgi:transcriptional regulator with XRE-family HTH domain